MGCGASRNRARHDDPIVPLPALHPLRRRLSPAPFERTPRARSVTPPPTQRRPRGGRETDSPPARDEEWPLPPKGGNATFETKWFTDKERYSLIRAYNKKVRSHIASFTRFCPFSVASIDAGHDQSNGQSRTPSERDEHNTMAQGQFRYLRFSPCSI